MRVERCFAFVDLCGFTTFADRQGDERAVVVLAELRTALREISARRGVRVVKWLGDGAMLSSTMTDALVAAVVEVRARLGDSAGSLSLRSGISSGPVIMFEGDDYIGRAVNVASRLSDAASAGRILATDEVMDALPPWVCSVRADARSLRGLDATVSVVELDLLDPGDDPVIDPVCGLVVPAAVAVPWPESGVDVPGADGSSAAAGFCSEACAGSWLAAVS